MTQTIKNIQKFLLSFAIITLPVTNLPRVSKFFYLDRRLSFYFLLFGILLWLYDAYKNNNALFVKNQYKIYFFIFIFSQLITFVLGLIYYDSWNLLLINKIYYLTLLNDFCRAHNILINSDICIKFYVIVKFLKDILINNIFIGYLISFYIYYLFHKNWKEGFSLIKKSAMFLLYLFIVYSIIEILYFNDFVVAKNILIKINSFLYSPLIDNYWYPPMLWSTTQLRSFCTEPSFFGIFSSFCLPFVFLHLLSTKVKPIYILIYGFFIYMIFLTQSRTAIFLYAFETAFLVSFILFIRKTIIKPLLIIISCSLFAFILCLITLKISNPEFKDNQTNLLQPVNFYINKNISSIKISNPEFKDNQTNLLQPVNFYINKNISSIYSKKERSNPERLALMTAHLKVGLEHPIFGVGIKMTDSYVIKKLSQNACNLPSIKEKILLAGKNIFKTDLPPLNHYINIFSSSGLSGLFIFLLPVVYIIYKIINNRYLLKNRKYICILIIVTTQMVAMLTTEAFLSFYISFGLLLCMTDNITEKHIKNNTKHNESNIF